MPIENNPNTTYAARLSPWLLGVAWHRECWYRHIRLIEAQAKKIADENHKPWNHAATRTMLCSMSRSYCRNGNDAYYSNIKCATLNYAAPYIGIATRGGIATCNRRTGGDATNWRGVGTVLIVDGKGVGTGRKRTSCDRRAEVAIDRRVATNQRCSNGLHAASCNRRVTFVPTDEGGWAGKM